MKTVRDYLNYWVELKKDTLIIKLFKELGAQDINALNNSEQLEALQKKIEATLWAPNKALAPDILATLLHNKNINEELKKINDKFIVGMSLMLDEYKVNNQEAEYNLVEDTKLALNNLKLPVKRTLIPILRKLNLVAENIYAIVIVSLMGLGAI